VSTHSRLAVLADSSSWKSGTRGINSAVEDQFNGDAIRQYLQKIGIMYGINCFGPQLF
jgi:hypothetical protein